MRQPRPRPSGNRGALSGRRVPLMSVTAPAGFVAAGLHCGIKESGDPDLSLVATSDGKAVPAAGVFTQNLACAGPARVSREHLSTTRGHAAAVVLNSGNAN